MFCNLYLGGDEGVPGELVGCCLTKWHQFFLLRSHLTAYFFSEEFKWGYQDKGVVTSVGWLLVYGFCWEFLGILFLLYVCL